MHCLSIRGVIEFVSHQVFISIRLLKLIRMIWVGIGSKLVAYDCSVSFNSETRTFPIIQRSWPISCLLRDRFLAFECRICLKTDIKHSCKRSGTFECRTQLRFEMNGWKRWHYGHVSKWKANANFTGILHFYTSYTSHSEDIITARTVNSSWG